MSEYVKKSEVYRLLNKGDSLTLRSSAEAYQKVTDMISCMKSEDVKPVVHGEWMTGTGILRYTCSVCSTACMGSTNFCPHCGADMRGDK